MLTWVSLMTVSLWEIQLLNAQITLMPQLASCQNMRIPCKQIPYLENLIDSEKMIVTLPMDRQKKDNLSCKMWASIRKVAQVNGMLVASFSAVELGKLHYRQLEKSKTVALKKHKREL